MTFAFTLESDRRVEWCGGGCNRVAVAVMQRDDPLYLFVFTVERVVDAFVFSQVLGL